MLDKPEVWVNQHKIEEFAFSFFFSPLFSSILPCAKKKSTGFVKKNARQGSGMHSEGYDNGDLLMAVSEEGFLEWIMDSGGSFHMTPRRDFLFDFKEFNGCTVLVG
nr:hypothetical protein [Tanacetum cinerariifolium]